MKNNTMKWITTGQMTDTITADGRSLDIYAAERHDGSFYAYAERTELGGAKSIIAENLKTRAEAHAAGLAHAGFRK